MKRNKGFIFAETIIVVAVLATALIMLYSMFTAIMNNEKRRSTFEDVAMIYRTYYLGRYLNEVKSYDFTTGLTDKHLVEQLSKAIVPTEEGGFWESLMASDALDLAGLYIAKKDLSGLQNCNSALTDCSINDYAAGNGWRTYLKTISSKKDSGYQILGVYGFGKSKHGTECLNFVGGNDYDEICRFYYASLDVGES